MSTAPKIVATLLCRLDHWSIRLAILSALEWCDEIVIGLHEPGGTALDPTWEIIAKLSEDSAIAARLDIVSLMDTTWDEMEMRQRLLVRARELGATHIAIVDADEAVTADLLERVHNETTVRKHVLALAPRETLEVPMVSPHHGAAKCGFTLDHARIDGVFASARITLAFGDHPSLFWKNAADGYRFHNRPPYGITKRTNLETSSKTSGVFHLQYAVQSRLGAKAAYYKIIERQLFPDRQESQPNELNRKYDWTLQDRGEQYVAIPASAWSYRFGDGRALVDLTELPWQAWAVWSMVKKVHPSVLTGLELHEWSWEMTCTKDAMPAYAATL